MSRYIYLRELLLPQQNYSIDRIFWPAHFMKSLIGVLRVKIGEQWKILATGIILMEGQSWIKVSLS